MSATPLQISEMAKRTFSNRFEAIVQQQQSKLMDKCIVDEFSGKEKVYNDLGLVVWEEETTRLGESTPQEASYNKRKSTKRNFKCQVIFDKWDSQDIEQQLTTPGSEIERQMMRDWHKKIDDLVISAISADVYGGVEPYVTPISITDARRVAVDYVRSGGAANSGLTVAKLRRLTTIFELGDVMMGTNTISGVNPDKVFIAIGPQQKNDLSLYVETAPNAPFAQSIGAWLDGKQEQLLGFYPVLTNRLPIDGTGIRKCPAWTREGLYIIPDQYQVKIDVLAEKNHSIQIAAYTRFAAMRRFEEYVGEIYADETP